MAHLVNPIARYSTVRVRYARKRQMCNSRTVIIGHAAGLPGGPRSCKGYRLRQQCIGIHLTFGRRRHQSKASFSSSRLLYAGFFDSAACTDSDAELAGNNRLGSLLCDTCCQQRSWADPVGLFRFRGKAQELGCCRLQSSRVYGSRVVEVLSHFPLPSEFFFIFGFRNAYFGPFSGPSEYLFLHCNTSRSRPPVRLPSLTLQADYGSVKGAGVPPEEDTEHYLPWW